MRLHPFRRWKGVYDESGFKGLLRHLITPPRKLVPLKAGWIFFGFMLIILVFAYITNNNLLFLLFAAMLTILIFSGVMSEASLGRIEVVRRFPDAIFKNTPFSLELQFHNRAKFFSAYAFFVHDTVLEYQEMLPFLAMLKPGQKAKRHARAKLKKRGWIQLPGYELRTQFPFLLFLKTRRIAGKEALLVYPAVHPVFLDGNELLGEAKGETQSTLKEEGSAISHLKEYADGEPVKRIDWKKSAQLDNLFIKEFEQPNRREIDVVLSLTNERFYEAGLEKAASLLLWLEERSIPYALYAGAFRHEKPALGYRHLHEGLRALALMEGEQTTTPPPKLERGRIEVIANGEHRIR